MRAAWCRHYVLYISFYCFFIYQLKMSFITSCLPHRQNRQPWYNWSIGERSVNNKYTFHAHLLSPSFLISILSWKFLIEINMHVDLQLTMQSGPITTRVANSNQFRSWRGVFKHYVIKFVIDLLQVGGFLRVLLFLPLM